MATLTYDNILAGSYLLMWVLTLIWYQRRNSAWDSGSTLIALNAMYAVFAIITFNDDVLPFNYKPLRLFPYIYLYCMLMLAMLPLIRHHDNPAQSIEMPQTRMLTAASMVIIAISILMVPGMLGNGQTGLVKLFTDSDAGKEAYIEMSKEQADAGSGISNILSIIYNALQDIGVFLFFYFMTLKKKKKLITTALGFSFVISFIAPVLDGQRTGTINSLLLATGAYMLFRRYLPAHVNKVVRRMGIVAIALIMLPVGAITFSRFDGRGAAGVTSFLNFYIGQASINFNNHALNAGGTRNGERICNMFLQLVNPDTPKNFVERRDKYHNLEIDDNLFTTFVGDFCIDFGPITAVVIFLVIYLWVTWQTRPRDGTLKLHQLFLLYITMAIYIQGNMYLFSYADTGNLRLIAMAMFYIYLSYHEKLLERFPLARSESGEEAAGVRD